MLKRKRRDKRSWSDLPPELLELIVERINSSRILILRFRAVCKSWRACCPLPPRNKLFPVNLVYHPEKPFKTYLTKSTLYLIVEPSSKASKSKQILSTPWLVMLDDLNQEKFSIRSPLTKNSLFYSSFTKPLNVLDLHVFEIAQSFTISRLIHDTTSAKFRVDYWNRHIHKVLTLPGSDQYLSVLDSFGALDIYKFSDDSWIHHCDLSQHHKLDDIVQYKGRIVGIDRRGKVYGVEPDKGTFAMNTTSRGIRAGTGRRKRLVATEDDGCLYLLLQCDEVDKITVHFKVYKLDEIQGRWFSVGSLNDHVFIVGTDFSASFPAQRYPQFQFQGNNIFASDYSFRPYHGRRSNEMLDLFSMIGRFSVEYGGSYLDLDSDSCVVFWTPPSLLPSILK